MWHLKNIPKIAHFFWGGGKLPYLRYLTLSTFKKLNPDWQIILYTTREDIHDLSWTTTEHKYGWNYDDYWDKAKVDAQFILFNIESVLEGMSEVHKADYLRWYLLHYYGGLWSDMDILYTKSMDSLYFNTPQNEDRNMVICNRVYGHSVGFLMGQVFNSYYGALNRASKEEYDKEYYQCMGSTLFNKMFPRDLYNSINMSMDVVYPWDANHVKELFSDKGKSRITENTIGVHWYAGSQYAGKFLNETNGGLYLNDNSIMSELIRHEN